MYRSIPMEADWTQAPELLEGAMSLQLTPEKCDLDYWIKAVAQGTWHGLVNGHALSDVIPSYLFEAGPLRSAVVAEFAFRAIAEELATRAISYLVVNAPDIPTMEFFSTQLLDEARHARAFRNHLLELGVEEENLVATIEEAAGDKRDTILRPLEAFGLNVMRDQRDFIGGVIVLTVLVEGVLAPSGALSERKWRPLDPAGAGIAHGANIDELRHLTVGSSIVRRHLIKRPEEKARLLSLISEGNQLWHKLPALDMLFEREVLFQQGLEAHAAVVGDYELVPGRRLVETTVEERLAITQEWSREVQSSRMAFMGLE